jgi:peptidoglycan/xylan/chitin deacetylase (PgdA/CDA1 family)
MRFISSILAACVFGAIVSSVQAVGYTHCKNNNIALTFDDGATKFTRSVIDQLVAAKQHATFCINLHNYGEHEILAE